MLKPLMQACSLHRRFLHVTQYLECKEVSRWFAVLGKSVAVVVIASCWQDKYGNLRSTGGDLYDISFEGPCGLDIDLNQHSSCGFPTQPPPMVNIVDVGQGGYVAMYTLTVGGRYTMSVRLHGLHIRGSPFNVVSQPDAALLVAATGATFGQSHIRFNATEPYSGAVGERMYTYFAVAVPDMVSDLFVTVSEVQGEVDVLVSLASESQNHQHGLILLLIALL